MCLPMFMFIPNETLFHVMIIIITPITLFQEGNVFETSASITCLLYYKICHSRMSNCWTRFSINMIRRQRCPVTMTIIKTTSQLGLFSNTTSATVKNKRRERYVGWKVRCIRKSLNCGHPMTVGWVVVV